MKGTLYFVLLSMLITGCSKYQTPITKRTQMMLLSKSQEIEIGKSDFKKILKNCSLCHDKDKNTILSRVGKRLAQTVKSHNYNWEFVLVENETINASCLPGGKVIVNSGVFKVIKNDDQLATILAHEMAHAISRHGNARISRARVLNTVEGAGTIVTGLINPFMIIPFILAYEAGTKQAVTLPNMRVEEHEADVIGLNLMNQAGYDLNEALLLWKNIKKVNSHKAHIKNSTHLTYDKRIEEIHKTIEKINQAKKVASK